MTARYLAARGSRRARPAAGDRRRPPVRGYWLAMAAPSLSYAESVVIARSPRELYEMISDVTRMGEWSPVCAACWWDDGAGPRVGSWFTGRNEEAGDTWETRSVVVVAEPGREFAFQVGGDRARWGYTFTPAGGGTLVTESWEFLPAGLAFFQERFGADAPAQIAVRARDARAGIPATLAALKRVAESG
jgi:Polyketide cyclase / dehydrase and lipid transport